MSESPERFRPGADFSGASWHEAAARCPFAYFQAVSDGRSWAGDVAADGSLIQVRTEVDGGLVSVTTTQRRDVAVAEDRERREAVASLLWRHVSDESGPLQLPYRMTVEADDRDIVVGNERVTVEGVRLAGDPHWVGMFDVGDTSVTVTCTSTSTSTSGASIRLRVCDDPASVEPLPPDGGIRFRI